MPSYSHRSRAALLSMATPLVAAARELFSEPGVLSAATTVEDAAVALDLEVGGRRGLSARLSVEAAAVAEGEADLDRRVSGLHRALDGLAALGLDEAAALQALLFPSGLRVVVSPRGRAQVPEFSRLADGIGDALARPEAARLEPMLSGLREALRAWCAATLAKDSTHRAGSTSAASAASAADSLRAALMMLDRVVEVAAGGRQAPLYERWALVVQGIG